MWLLLTGLVSALVANVTTRAGDSKTPSPQSEASSAGQKPLERRTVTLERRALEEVVSLRGVLATPPATPLRAPLTGVVGEVRAQVNGTIAAGAVAAVIRRAEPGIAGDPIEVTSPRAGVVRDLVAPGTRVLAGDPIGSVQPGGLDAVATVDPPEAQYSLLAPPVALRAAIAGGPAGFACPLIGLDSGEGKVQLRCQIPPDVKAFAGLTVTLVLVTARVPDALVLPRSAVFGVEGQGEVVVLGAPDQRRRVTLGIADDMAVQIVDGLQMGEKVLLRPTLDDLARAR